MESPSEGQKDMQEFGEKAYHSAAAQQSRAHGQPTSPGPGWRPSRAREQTVQYLRLRGAEKGTGEKQ